jgi:hypothetical protein
MLDPIIRTVYMYVSKDVRIRGYFFEAKGGPRAKPFGKHSAKLCRFLSSRAVIHLNYKQTTGTC